MTFLINTKSKQNNISMYKDPFKYLKTTHSYHLCPVGAFSTEKSRFYNSTPDNPRDENPKTTKTMFFDMFLKYQFTICTEPSLPFSHYIYLSLLTCVFSSARYLVLYGLSILYILITISLAHIFPNSFGSWYLSFLKRHYTPEVFKKYCGNPFGALKAVIKNPEFIKTLYRNGGGKFVAGVGVVLLTEHTFTQAKLGQIYDYQVDKFLNDGKHSSGEPFSFDKTKPQSVLKDLLSKK